MEQKFFDKLLEKIGDLDSLLLSGNLVDAQSVLDDIFADFGEIQEILDNINEG